MHTLYPVPEEALLHYTTKMQCKNYSKEDFKTAFSEDCIQDVVTLPSFAYTDFLRTTKLLLTHSGLIILSVMLLLVLFSVCCLLFVLTDRQTDGRTDRQMDGQRDTDRCTCSLLMCGNVVVCL